MAFIGINCLASIRLNLLFQHDDQSQQLLHTELIYYHTLGVRLVRYSCATLTLHKRYQYVQSTSLSFVLR